MATNGLIRSPSLPTGQKMTVAWAGWAMGGSGMFGRLSDPGRPHHLLDWHLRLECGAGVWTGASDGTVTSLQVLCKV